MKFAACALLAESYASSPARGTWIEIMARRDMHSGLFVVPRTGDVD